MEKPTPSDSLPQYLADGIPKQDTETLHDIHAYVEALIEFCEQPVGEDELPETSEPVDDTDTSGKGTVVKERVKCSDGAVSAQAVTHRICPDRISTATIAMMER